MQLLSTLVFVGVACASVSRMSGRSSPATKEPSTSLASSTDASPSSASTSESIPLELDGAVKIVASIRMEEDDTQDRRFGFVVREEPLDDVSTVLPDPPTFSVLSDGVITVLSDGVMTVLPDPLTPPVPSDDVSTVLDDVPPTTTDSSPTTTDSADGDSNSSKAWIAGPVVGGCAGLLLVVGVAYLFRRKRAKRASPEDAGGLYEKPQLHSDCIPRNAPEEAEDPVFYEMQGSIPQPAEMTVNEAPARELPLQNTT